MRSAIAAQRRAVRAQVAHARQTEREASKLRKELLRQQAEMQKADAAARAKHEVLMFENYLELIISLHKDGWSPWNWQDVANSPAPAPAQFHEQSALAALHGYQPSLVDRTMGKDKVVRAQLEQAVVAARQADSEAHRHQHAQWEWYRRVGQGVVQGDLAAYGAVIDYLMPFGELEELGIAVAVKAGAADYAEAHASVRDEEIVPADEIKLLATQKVSTKEMAKSKYWALYQDHVCSAALRVGRELFALLPIQTAYVHIGQPGTDPATGQPGTITLTSVAFERKKFLGLNLDKVDPSNAVSTFRHKMQFKKTTGFSPVDPLVPGSAG